MRNRGLAGSVLTLLVTCVELAPCRGLAQETGWDCLLVNSAPEANANPLHNITFTEDRFIAVGDAGTVIISTNGLQWLRQPTPTQNSLYGVTADARRFIAVGDAGCLLFSTNSYDWELAAPIPGKNLRAVAYGNGVYVVMTDQYQLLVSSDALNWRPSTNGVPAYPFPIGVYFGGNRFVAYGPNGRIASSADGLNWTGVDLGVFTTFAYGAYGGGVFVVAGHEDFRTHQVAYSNDGITWTAVSMTSPNDLWYGLCYGEGRFVGINAGVICSTDGHGWGTCGGGFPVGRLGAYGLGQYVALGERGLIYTSTNLSDWVVRSAPVCPMSSAAYGNGVYVASYGSSIYTSTDGVHFVEAPGPTASLTPVTFANGLFVAGGSGGMVVSSDGTNWATFPAPCTDFLRTVQYANGTWVGLCSSLFSCSDATNWTVRVASPGYLVSLAYGANRWVSCGVSGRIWSSADGTNWLNCSYNTTAFLGPIASQEGLFSIFSAGGYMLAETALISKDGINWTDAGQSGPLLAIHQEAASNGLVLSLAGKWGGIYGLERSTDLTKWVDSQEITNVGGVTSLGITEPGSQGAAYFRAVER